MCDLDEAMHKAGERKHKEDGHLEKKLLHSMIEDGSCKVASFQFLNRIPKKEIAFVAKETVDKKWVMKNTIAVKEVRVSVDWDKERRS